MGGSDIADLSGRHGASATSYFFTGNSSGLRNVKGVLTERGPIMGLGMFFALSIVGFTLYSWSRHDTLFDSSLIFALLVLAWFAWHYLGLVVEINLTPEHLSLRRLKKFRSISWEKISRVELYSLTTMGITYVCVAGHSRLPQAIFPLISGYPPENWQELTRLVEELKSRVAVKHTK